MFGGTCWSRTAFSLHCLKTTPLSWSAQLEVDEVKRSLQGHHRFAGDSTCAKPYTSNHVGPQLSCQRRGCGCFASRSGAACSSAPGTRVCFVYRWRSKVWKRPQWPTAGARMMVPRPSVSGSDGIGELDSDTASDASGWIGVIRWFCRSWSPLITGLRGQSCAR